MPTSHRRHAITETDDLYAAEQRRAAIATFDDTLAAGASALGVVVVARRP